MNLSERKKQILGIVVQKYVQNAEPVGSKAVAAELSSSVSSATVRNELAELESLGLLEQPHTSAGRTPTALGYRLFVNEIMHRHSLSNDDAQRISNELQLSTVEKQHVLDKAGTLTSRLTTYPAYAMASTTGSVNVVRFDFIYVDSFTFIIVVLLSNDIVKNKLVHLVSPIDPNFLTRLSTVFNASFTAISEERITASLITSTERALGDNIGIVAVAAGYTIELLYKEKSAKAHISGATNILSHPEYRDADKAQRLINYLSDTKELARLPSPEAAGEIKITIGPENLADELRDSSVMAVRYDAGGDMQGLIGVVGPTRMDYSKVAARLSYIARELGQLLSGAETPLSNSLSDDNNDHSIV